MPGDKQQQTIVAFINENDNHQFPLTVLIVNNGTKEILARFSDEKAPYLNGIGDPTKITIDTGRYIVAPNQRAFGVRVRYSLNSWDSTEDLFLFLKEKSNLKEIVSGLTVAFSSAHACYSNELTGTISVSRRSTNGFSDLFVKTKATSVEGLQGVNGECDNAAPITKTELRTLHFKDNGINGVRVDFRLFSLKVASASVGRNN